MRGLTASAAGAVLSICACCGSAAAQDNRVTAAFKPLSYPIDPEAFEKGLSAGEREIYDLIENLVYVRLKKTLEIDDAAMKALAFHAGPAKNQLTMLKWERATLIEHLRWCLDVGLTDAGLQEKLNTLVEYDEQIARLLGEMVHGSEACLGARGGAKLYLFVDDFERFLAKRILEAIERTHKAGDAAPAGEEELAPAVEPEMQKFTELVRSENRDVPLSGFANDDVIRLVDALLMVRLTQALDLSQQQSIKLSAHVGAHKDQLHQLKWQIGARRAALRESIETGDADDEIQQQLDDLLIQEQAVARLVSDIVSGAGQDVSVEQSVRLYLFLGDFEQYIVGLLERAHG
jgi:hypothetical protein